MNLNTTYYVYMLINPFTNIPFYVGKGKGNRCFRHIQKNQHTNLYCKNTINKIKYLGGEPIIQKFCYGTEEYCLDVEKKLIAHFGKKWNKTGCLTNIVDGGVGTSGGSYKMTEEHRQNIIKGTTGIKRSEETKIKISTSRKGMKLSDSHKNNIGQAISRTRRGENNFWYGKPAHNSKPFTAISPEGEVFNITPENKKEFLDKFKFKKNFVRTALSRGSKYRGWTFNKIPEK